jgi:hypothetical protein
MMPPASAMKFGSARNFGADTRATGEPDPLNFDNLRLKVVPEFRREFGQPGPRRSFA